MGLISLGCAKNLVDAEIMLGSLLKDGVEITNDPALADVMIVNTCSFIDSAQEESVDTILESAAVREAKNASIIPSRPVGSRLAIPELSCITGAAKRIASITGRNATPAPMIALSRTGISMTIPRTRSGAITASSSAVFAPSDVPRTTAWPTFR